MCASSVVSDYYMRTWPERHGSPSPFHTPPSGGSIFTPTIDAETKEMMRKVLQLLDKIDKKLGDVECIDDAKAAFLKQLDLDPNNISGG